MAKKTGTKKTTESAPKGPTKKEQTRADAVLALRSFHGNADDAERVIDAIIAAANA